MKSFTLDLLHSDEEVHYRDYYHIENFRSVKTKLWERPTMRGEGIWPIRPERIKYWMEWPTPPKEEQHETD